MAAMRRNPHPSAYGPLETAETLTEEQIEARTRALVDALTLKDRIALMHGDLPFWSGLVKLFRIKQYAFSVGGENLRKGLPGFRFSDGPRGICLDGSTTFTAASGRAAAWDPAQEERVGDVMGRELRALGGNLYGGVCVNLLRHPANGRAQESFGEDPLLLGELGAATVRGVQRHSMACVKHYCLNSMENARFQVDVTCAPRPLHEIYLRHFRRVVQEGVACVMSSYNSVNGEWAGQNKVLLRDILKDDWGFAGFVVTDWILGMRDAKKAALAGQDLEMPFWMHYQQHLPGLIASGEVPESVLEESALRKVRQLVRFGQGRDPADYDPEIVGCAEHRALSREVAARSMVLLKNEGDLLPLRGVRRLAVIGKLADTANTGDRGSSNTHPDEVITPLRGLREALGSDAVIYQDGSDLEAAAEAAAGADAVLVVVGYTYEDEGEYIPADMMTRNPELLPKPRGWEKLIARALKRAAAKAMAGGQSMLAPGGDRVRLTLRSEDEALIAAVAAANPHTIVGIEAGSAVIMEAWRERVPAILMMWYPGQEGGRALADVLLGEVNPGGRLPVVFVKDPAHLPYFDKDATEITYDMWHGYRKLARDGNAPAFPFGYGLSYTTFALSDLRLEKDTITPGEDLLAHVRVTNTGERDGDEVVQLYIAVPESRVERAPFELKGFKRVSVPAGETVDVEVRVRGDDLAYYDESDGWTVEPGRYIAIVGRHSLDDQALRAGFTVEGTV